MILIPKFNIYSKYSRWQDRTFRRLRLLKFVGPRFWMPEDFALANVHMSVSAFPYGTMKPAGGGGVGTLALTTLSAVSIGSFPLATITWWRDGDVYEQGVAQSPSTQYTDNTDTDIGDYIEVKMDQTSGSGTASFSNPWSENSYIAISATRVCSLGSSLGTKTALGTAYVREIANTSNNVSATFSLWAEKTGGGILGILQ